MPDEPEQILEQLNMEDLRRAIQIGIDQADRAELIEGEEVFVSCKKEMRT